MLSEPGASYEMRKVYLSFRGPKGNNFGQEIVFELQVMLDQPKAES
jgi:hypothetical protein